MTKLPKRVTIPKDVIDDWLNLNDTAIADYLSDEYGFCVNSLEVEVIAKNIKWDLKD